MNFTKASRLWLTAVLPLVGLMACHDDDEPTPPDPADMISTSIVGDWLQNQSDEHMILLGEIHYDESGDFSMNTVMVNTEINEIFNTEGTWEVTDEDLATSYISPFTGAMTTTHDRLMYTGKYSIIVEDGITGEITQSDRIVESHTLPIGETVDFSIDDSDFVAQNYKSTDSHVASVDENGRIEARHPGVTYIIASSDLGNAVNKVTVTSPLIIDDYLQYMLKPIQEVTAELGNIYVDVANNATTARIFQLPNPLVYLVEVDYAIQLSRMIFVSLRPGTDMQPIMEAWDKVFDNTAASKSTRQYIIERDGQKYFVMMDSNGGMISIMPYTEPTPPPTPDFNEADFTQFMWLPGSPVQEVANKLNYTITDENMEDGFLDTITLSDNGVFEQLNVLFDEEEEPWPVTSIYMRTKKGVTEDNLKEWLGALFTATGEDLNPYTYDGAYGKVYVYYKTSGARLNVYYSTSKRRR